MLSLAKAIYDSCWENDENKASELWGSSPKTLSLSSATSSSWLLSNSSFSKVSDWIISIDLNLLVSRLELLFIKETKIKNSKPSVFTLSEYSDFDLNFLKFTL